MTPSHPAPNSSKRFLLNEEERIVKDIACHFVADRMPIRLLRALRDKASVDGFDRAAWAEVIAAGWTGIAIPEAFGGSGLGIKALAAIIEETGKTLAPLPLASTALVAPTVIDRFASPEVARRWLPNIAAGTVLAALAVDEIAQQSTAVLETCVRCGPNASRLSGMKRYVADGAAADLLLVSVKCDDGAALALIRANAPGVAVEPLTPIDGRGMADIRFDDVPIDFLLTDVDGRNPVEYALDCARIGLAAEMLGASSVSD